MVSAVESIPNPSNSMDSRAELCSAFVHRPLTSGAVSDNALLLFAGFSWPSFSELGSQVLLPDVA